MQLSDLNSEAVRLILRLIGVAKERMNVKNPEEEGEEEIQLQNVLEGLEEYALHSREHMGKSPKCFLKSNDL